MATAQENGGGALAAAAGSAREFAKERLRDAGEAMAPAELADEYGCSSGHMRNVLREMRRDGAVGRPEVGQYEVPVGEDIEVEPDGVAGELPNDGDGADAEADAEAPADGAGGAPVGAGLGAAAAGLGTMASGDGDGLSTSEIVLAVAGLAVVVYLLTSSSTSTSSGSRTRSEEEKQGGAFDPMA